PKTPVGLAYVLALGGSVLLSLALSCAVWAKARRPPAVYLVTGNDDPKVVTPGVIPDSLARDFARDFFTTLETYVPSTVERNLEFLKARIAPETCHEFERFAENLKKLVRESRQASQLFVLDPATSAVHREGNRLEIVFRALRRLYVEQALLQETPAIYRLAILPGEPTRENPTGLVVAGFSFKAEKAGPEKEEASRAK
ncbi:MAG TPA: hypothetical protein VEN81_17755, partial [Planctomycetota bacterium]|nr:hypothetical protein [Planctomycetota bacterium]